MSKLIIKPKFVSPPKTLDGFPEKVLDNRDILKLKIGDNGIKGIPKEIENLARLETLDVSNNRIVQVYSKVFELSKLKILNFNDNRLINLPKQIAKLQKLRVLQLQNNNLSSLPPEMAALENLRELNIAYNKLKTFPKVLYELKNLRTLWLGGNFLTDFPLQKIFYELPNLKRLYTYSKINYKTNNVHLVYKKYNAKKGNNIVALRNEVDIKPPLNTGKTIFISYAHEDKPWLEKLTPYLKVLQNEGLKIEPWDDRKIASGDQWRAQIKNNLENSDAAILLISTPFLASDFITKNELPPLLELAQKRGLRIFCVIVGYSRFTNHNKLSIYQTVNNPNEPLSSFVDRPHEIERVFVKLSNEVSRHFNST